MSSTIDRTGWPPGPWDSEPDSDCWADPLTGLPCRAERGQVGHWCGYVGVERDHPLHAVGYNDCAAPWAHPVSYVADEGTHWNHMCTPEEMVSVHGGLTYSEFEGSDTWWFGFDCAHWSDLVPGAEAAGITRGGEYRTLGYVRQQCARLALDLWAVAPVELYASHVPALLQPREHVDAWKEWRFVHTTAREE